MHVQLIAAHGTTYKHYGKDLMCTVHEETQHQDCIDACRHRSPTWRILRALKSVNETKVVSGESAGTAAPFFESAGSLVTNQTILGTTAKKQIGAVGKPQREAMKVLKKETDWISDNGDPINGIVYCLSCKSRSSHGLKKCFKDD
jgi:hypothetical protein